MNNADRHAEFKQKVEGEGFLASEECSKHTTKLLEDYLQDSIPAAPQQPPSSHKHAPVSKRPAATAKRRKLVHRESDREEEASEDSSSDDIS